MTAMNARYDLNQLMPPQSEAGGSILVFRTALFALLAPVSVQNVPIVR